MGVAGVIPPRHIQDSIPWHFPRATEFIRQRKEYLKEQNIYIQRVPLMYDSILSIIQLMIGDK